MLRANLEEISTRNHFFVSQLYVALNKNIYLKKKERNTCCAVVFIIYEIDHEKRRAKRFLQQCAEHVT